MELSKKLAHERLAASFEHQQETHKAAIEAKEAVARAKYEDALCVYAEHEWLATSAALTEKLSALGAEGPSPAKDEVMVGQIRRALAHGWGAELLARDKTLDMRLGQGGGNVGKKRAALKVTCEKLFIATAEPTQLASLRPRSRRSSWLLESPSRRRQSSARC